MKNDKGIRNHVSFLSRFLGTYLVLILAVGIFLFSPVARAAPLDLLLYDFPDFQFSNTDVSYNAATNVFTAIGNATVYLDGVHGNAPDVSCNINASGWGSAIDNIVITAKIDENGALDLSDPDPSMNTLHITGIAWDMYTPYSTILAGPDLLIGDLVDFGFPAPASGSSDTLEFLFAPTGGDAKERFLEVYYLGGITLSLLGGMPTEDPWASSWTSSSISNGGDVAPAPIPGAAWLLGSGLIGFAGIRRRFKRN